MSAIRNSDQAAILEELAAAVVANKAWLSEIDGRIGGGDHGINMAKGFGRAAERVHGREVSFSEALAAVGDVLVSEIGGSTGPLYGLMFEEMAAAIADREAIDAAAFSAMLNGGLDAVRGIGGAEIGDKTLMDTLVPAVAAFDAARPEGFAPALAAMREAAEKGRDSTIDLVAKIGRASRLGERSRGVVDAGAASCCLILTERAASIEKRLA